MTWPDPVNRIPPAVITDEAAQALAKTPTLPDGSQRNIFTTLAWHPLLLKRFNAFTGTFMRFGTLSARDREVVVLRVAATTRCRYELGQHLPIAAAAGVSEPTVTALLRVGDDRSGLSEGDALLVDTTDAVLATGTVDDDLWSRLAQRFDEPQLIELLVLIGTYRMVADLLNVAGVQLEPDMKAEVSQWI